MSLEAELVDILLVEDSEDDVELTRAAFEDAQVANRLYVARHGEEAMDFVHRRPPFESAPRPDLILLDLNLPRKDGREVLEEIKADPGLAPIPVVILTTSASDEDIARAYQHHANSYIRKPVTFDGLVGAVRTLQNYWLGMVTLPPH
jgi:CheY-like chemotaxis protein